MPKLDVIVIGMSAGGLEALREILGGVSATLPAAVLVVVHTSSDGTGQLADVLGRDSQLPVAFAKHGERLEAGRVYVAPPNVHLMVNAAGAVLNQGPRENGFRPGIDPLFRTAARVYGARVMGIVLSGALDDGTYGLKLIKDAGGLAVVQDPGEAMVTGMPLSAIRHVEVDHVLGAAAIASLIDEWAGETGRGGDVVGRDKESEPLGDEEDTVRDMNAEFGPAAGLTCPDCGGALWEIKEGKLVRYRCHVGHQYSSEGLDAGQRDAVEYALWAAVRVLEEHADLRSRMSRRADLSGLNLVASSFADSSREAHAQAQQIRDVLMQNSAEPAADELVASAMAPAPVKVRVNGKPRPAAAKTARRRK